MIDLIIIVGTSAIVFNIAIILLTKILAKDYFRFGAIYPLKNILFPLFYTLPLILIIVGWLNFGKLSLGKINVFVLVIVIITSLTRLFFYPKFSPKFLQKMLTSINFKKYLFLTYFYYAFIITTIPFMICFLFWGPPQRMMSVGLCFLVASFPFRYNRWLRNKENNYKGLYEKNLKNDYKFAFHQTILMSIRREIPVFFIYLGSTFYQFFHELAKLLRLKDLVREGYRIEAIIYYRLQRYNEVLNLIHRGNTFLAKNKLQSSSTLHALKALSLANIGQEEKAAKILEKIKQDDSNNPHIYFYLGYVYWLLDEIDEALDNNRRSLAIDSTCPFAWRNDAFLLCNQALLKCIDHPMLFNKKLNEASKSINRAQTVRKGKYKNYAVITHTVGYIHLLKGCYRSENFPFFCKQTKIAFNCFLRGITTESYNESKFLLTLLFLIGKPNLPYIEFNLKAILYDLRDRHPKNKFYNMIQRNYERSLWIKENVRDAIYYNPKIALYHLPQQIHKPYIFDKVTIRNENEIDKISKFKRSLVG